MGEVADRTETQTESSLEDRGGGLGWGFERQKYITPPTISFVWILFGLLHRDPK